VVIKDDGTLVIADPDNEPEEGEPKWYDYCGEKRWANVVLINNDNRLKYFDTNGKMIEGLIGTEIPMNNNGYYKYSHVLAHFVYVPRYSYKIWNTNPYAYDNYIYKVEHSDGVLSDEVKTELDSKINEKTIDIIFHTKDVSFTSINEGDYKTMPAFMFDGNDLNGIWIGKFELTGTTTTPTVKPNLGTLRSQNLRNLFSKSLLFSGRDLNSSNSVVKKKNISDYGLKFAQVNSHMIKNSEWGAIAYLAHSLYGINGEIRINNYYYSNAPLTGCGASSASAASATTCAIPYGTPSAEENMYPQSTTGNISGIFDMSGGSREFVGGYFKNNTGKTDAGTLKNSSGFGETFNFETLNEYFDSYEIIDFDGTVINNKPNNVILNESILLSGGHAMFETAWWYEDFYDIDQGQFFIERGGYHSGGSLFYMTDNSGASNNAYSSRVVLAVTNLD